mmetsp:Transcript_38876/g.58404  ORF Transcript_38876/g.58404 Transcript_38876/m.58404 type:complete len:203 (-) Transcript_38876:1191-1799(-)
MVLSTRQCFSYELWWWRSRLLLLLACWPMSERQLQNVGIGQRMFCRFWRLPRHPDTSLTLSDLRKLVVTCWLLELLRRNRWVTWHWVFVFLRLRARLRGVLLIGVMILWLLLLLLRRGRVRLFISVLLTQHLLITIGSWQLNYWSSCLSDHLLHRLVFGERLLQYVPKVKRVKRHLLSYSTGYNFGKKEKSNSHHSPSLMPL